MSDVYSFGVILMELITGRRALDESQPESRVELVAWLRPQHRRPRETLQGTLLSPHSQSHSHSHCPSHSHSHPHFPSQGAAGGLADAAYTGDPDSLLGLRPKRPLCLAPIVYTVVVFCSAGTS